MATLKTILLFFFISSPYIVFYLPNKAASAEIYSNTFCDTAGLSSGIKFPFWLKRNCQNNRCGYPGFNLSCNNKSQTIIHLPFAGKFSVDVINYADQMMLISDPDDCLPKRLLKGFNLSEDSQFYAYSPQDYTFLNCSSDAPFTGISCLSSENYTVVGVLSGFVGGQFFSTCSEISTVSIPITWSNSWEFRSDLQLGWNKPACGSCEEEGGVCGFKSHTGLEVTCSNRPSHGLPRSAKYVIVIGVGIPGLLCLIGAACYVCGRRRTYGQLPHPSTEFSTSISPHHAVVLMGFDGPTIESFPKTVLGESKRLPKPNDGTCPICLSEYQPKDTLRTIPECNHYFHADCIDEWLRMNATCPICRNSPDGSSIATPSSSASFSSSSTFSTDVLTMEL